MEDYILSNVQKMGCKSLIMYFLMCVLDVFYWDHGNTILPPQCIEKYVMYLYMPTYMYILIKDVFAARTAMSSFTVVAAI